jgi:hypothetical protein
MPKLFHGLKDPACFGARPARQAMQTFKLGLFWVQGFDAGRIEWHQGQVRSPNHIKKFALICEIRGKKRFCAF